MARDLIDIPRADAPVVDGDGRLTPEWQRAFENLFYINRKLSEALDASSGTATGAAVDAEWNALVNKVKET